jgi:hypothetical protein
MVLEIVPEIPVKYIVNFLSELKSKTTEKIYIDATVSIYTAGRTTMTDILSKCTPIIPNADFDPSIKVFNSAHLNPITVSIRIESIDDLIELFTKGQFDSFTYHKKIDPKGQLQINQWTNICIDKVTLNDYKKINITMDRFNLELKVKPVDYNFFMTDLSTLKDLSFKIIMEEHHGKHTRRADC